MQQQLHLPFSARAAFYNSSEWIQLRFKTLLDRGRCCECCGVKAARGVCLQVDHVIPISVDPSRKLDPTNLQVLCYHCNHGKSARTVDFRTSKLSEFKSVPAVNDAYFEYANIKS